MRALAGLQVPIVNSLFQVDRLAVLYGHGRHMSMCLRAFMDFLVEKQMYGQPILCHPALMSGKSSLR